MNRVLFILPKGTQEVKYNHNMEFPKLGELAPIENGLIKEHYCYLVPDETIKLFRGGAFEEFPLSEAQAKLQDVYNSIDYIVFVNAPVREFLSTFDYMFDIFKEYVSPELGVLYTDCYRSGAKPLRQYLHSFTPEYFIQNIPPVVIVNKKYLPGLPLQMDQQVALHLANTSPILHIPEGTYILE